MPKKTLIIKLAQDASEYDDEYIEAMKIIFRRQARTNPDILGVDFELIVEDEAAKEANVDHLISQVRAEFRAHDGVEVTIKDGDESRG